MFSILLYNVLIFCNGTSDCIEKCYKSGKWDGKSKEFIEQYRKSYVEMANESPEDKPFQHPYYWAASTVNGA